METYKLPIQAVLRKRARVVLCQYNGLYPESFHGDLVGMGLNAVLAARVLQECSQYVRLVCYPENMTDAIVIVAKNKFESECILHLLGAAVFIEVNEYCKLADKCYSLVPQADDVTGSQNSFNSKTIKLGLTYYEAWLEGVFDPEHKSKQFVLKDVGRVCFFYAKVGKYKTIPLWTPGGDEYQFLDHIVEDYGSNVRKEVGDAE